MADMRLLSLGLLASDYEEIPYAEISRTLQVPQVGCHPLLCYGWVLGGMMVRTL